MDEVKSNSPPMSDIIISLNNFSISTFPKGVFEI